MTQPLVIAIDGLAATGKGSLARALAAALDLAYLDTGLIYRAVGLAVIRAGGDPAKAEDAEKAAAAFDPLWLENPDLKSDEAAKAASEVGVHPKMRDILLNYQRDFASHPPENKKGAVLDGRDIGTVIVPNAKVKIYVTASPVVRAKRRFLELQARGENVTEAGILEDMKARDARDQKRSAAPAVPAKDAVTLDTSGLNEQEALEAALRIVEEKLTS